MSPPLTLGLTGWVASRLRRCPMVFNIQDVFPDAAVETGAISNRTIIAAARWLERVSYVAADAVTVLSDDLRDNVVAKLGAGDTVHVIPNFVDTEAIVPADRSTPYRTELGLGDGPVVLYAGNVGFSQSLDLVLAAARELPDVMFLINGNGAARASLETAAADIANVRFADYIEPSRLSELLATGDVHVVPLRRGLGRVERAVEDLLDHGRRSAGRGVDRSGHRRPADPRRVGWRCRCRSRRRGSVHGGDPLAGRRSRAVHAVSGRLGRAWVEENASPAAVGAAYDELLRSCADNGARTGA